MMLRIPSTFAGAFFGSVLIGGGLRFGIHSFFKFTLLRETRCRERRCHASVSAMVAIFFGVSF